MIKHLFLILGLLAALTAEPVSYTHLGAYHSNVLDAGFSVFCLEGGQVEPATESGDVYKRQVRMTTVS